VGRILRNGGRRLHRSGERRRKESRRSNARRRRRHGRLGYCGRRRSSRGSTRCPFRRRLLREQSRLLCAIPNRPQSLPNEVHIRQNRSFHIGPQRCCSNRRCDWGRRRRRCADGCRLLRKHRESIPVCRVQQGVLVRRRSGIGPWRGLSQQRDKVSYFVGVNPGDLHGCVAGPCGWSVQYASRARRQSGQKRARPGGDSFAPVPGAAQVRWPPEKSRPAARPG
jgi:hypothetical protein